MRAVIAFAFVLLTVLVALGLAQTNVFVVSPLRATAPASSGAPTAQPRAPPVAVVSTEPAAASRTPAVAATSTLPGASVAPPAGASAAVAPPSSAPACPGNPNALGLARTVQVDTTGGPGFGFEHFKMHDFLKLGEVVLTFDDGPWPANTPAVLAALAAHCLKATFFPIGKHATYYPEILKQVAAAGHTIGSHTWSHADLSRKSLDDAKAEIEKGLSAVRWAVGGPTAPFFRFPSLKHPPELVTYLGERNIAIFSTDMDSFDFKMRKPEQVVNSVLERLKKHGKGIVLMHDFQHPTAQAIATLFDQLKLNGYKIVHMKAKAAVESIAAYDEMMLKEQKLPTASSRPTTDVVRTVAE